MDLYYEVTGHGKPVVMIHGGGSDSRDWTYLVPLMASHYQVITFDGRGCGQSPSQTQPANYIADVLNLLNHLRIEKAAVIGHSIGGQIATEFALSYPERLEELILVAPALSGFVHSPDLLASFQSIQAAAPDVSKMTELVVTSPFCSVIKNSPHRDLMRIMTEHNINRMFEWAAIGAVWPKPPAIDRLDELRTRTLFIRGTLDHDDIFTIENHFRLVPNIKFVQVAGGDHMLNLTHPEDLFHHITEFLED
ncbi:alpha/beta fold hydrolase [Paenibacillus sp. LMG 31460]|uniref:Alpha/beta fold hydrolase n=1 Tax=Paenibacillus germinis TaxID=2654979 RepID=A0ABX1YXN1_9BACL|nr:alpha/beta hydrolase [Paenibacillus germinis]NOU85732.1 alpha/beta fold hydrolase [Paenibacillus germinis]